MKKLLILIILVFGLKANAQRFNGYVVTNSNDTIKCRFSMDINIFDKSLFYDSKISKRAKIYTENGEKKTFKPTELKTVFITGTKQGDYKFVSLPQDTKHFYHEIIVGKLSYYVIYHVNLQGGYPLPVEYILKDGKLNKLGGALSMRKEVGELIKDYPELNEKWMDSNNYYKLYQIREVIKLYNEHFKN